MFKNVTLLPLSGGKQYNDVGAKTGGDVGSGVIGAGVELHLSGSQ
jgi:hypothetical protein